MPPEPKAKLKRKSSRRELESEFKFDGGHARELEIKRSRGEVSCAECRRLKIKCDKQIPCTSCQRRGCAALCPNGSLATGQGTRFVLAATEHLHRRISKLSGRVRELEDALAILHSKHSNQPHPLLDESVLDATGVEEMDSDVPEGSGDRKGKGGTGENSVEGGSGEVIDAFGTLSISDHGISRFFGPTGGSESLLMANLIPSENSSPQQKPRVAYRGSTSPANYDRDSSSLSPTSTHMSAVTSTSYTSAAGTSSSTEGPLLSTLALFSQAFPFTPLGLPSSEVMSLIESHLPSYERAQELVKVFFDQVSWLFRGLTQDQVESDMLPSIYRETRGPGSNSEGDNDRKDQRSSRGYEDSSGSSSQSTSRQRSVSAERTSAEEWNGPHDLALLFIVFAIGALVSSDDKDNSSSDLRFEDLEAKGDSQAPQSRHQVPPIVEHYHQLSRAALSLQPILEKPSIVTIQTLHLLSIYNAMSGDGDDRLGKGETGMEMTWSLITLASHLSMTIGLHRDSARWGLTPKMVQRRRIVFWDLFVADVWTSLNTGRPPSFSLAYIDCSFPQYEGDPTGKGKEDEMFEIWQFRFAAECVAEVSARTLTAEAPTYATIMELDRKVRDFPVPEPLTTDKESHGGEDGMALSFQKFVVEHIKETMLIYIHRSFFAQAIIEQPVNPLKSTYAPSFLAAYRASGTILKSVREQFSRFPNTAARFWTMWTFAFSAAVIFGTVVARGPRSPLASSAMIELDQACMLFSKAAVYSRRAARALPILMKLREKSRCALTKVRNNASSTSGDNGGLLWNIKNEDTDDELSIFAGHTRFVSARQRTSGNGTPSAESPPESAPYEGPSSSRTGSSGLGSIQSQDVTQYGMDVAMDMDRPMEYDAALRASTYQMQPRPLQQPRQSYPSSHQPQLRLSQISNLGSYHSQSISPSGTSPIGWRPGEGLHTSENSEFAIQRNAQRYPEPTTISIPPATPPPPAMSAVSHHERQRSLSQQPPHRQSQQFTYSYDRDGGPHSNANTNYPWESTDRYSSSNPESSAVRLSRPQYVQSSNQMYHPPPPTHSHREMYPPSHGVPSYHGSYQHSHSNSQSLPSQPQNLPAPGNAALQGLGLAARDSRLDERWSSFMQDSGLLDEVGNYPGQRR
ncbi:hypothetical protein Moror_14051 [Moniliophthora roreri MCA 2997]|uniref:Zn(2)-C6 fungal-type domain-containing protein n=1 Tax=Moniliophthora roreri (strain MCA 2997) TaxID=1381753 RepID=V2YT91_MONRO|nr:hypothetical protein Moror_14051 [Moniliophthora roreri MCA 2997]